MDAVAQIFPSEYLLAFPREHAQAFVSVGLPNPANLTSLITTRGMHSVLPLRCGVLSCPFTFDSVRSQQEEQEGDIL